jgi:hypothetical protein
MGDSEILNAMYTMNVKIAELCAVGAPIYGYQYALQKCLSELGRQKLSEHFLQK